MKTAPSLRFWQRTTRKSLFSAGQLSGAMGVSHWEADVKHRKLLWRGSATMRRQPLSSNADTVAHQDEDLEKTEFHEVKQRSSGEQLPG